MENAANLRTEQPTQDQAKMSREDNSNNAPQKSSFPSLLISQLTSVRQDVPESTSDALQKEYDVEDMATERANISGGALVNALHQQKVRKRKESLRKTALLGNGVLRLESRAARGHASRATSISPDNNRQQDAETLNHLDIATSHAHNALSQPSFYEELADVSPRPLTPPHRPLPSLSQHQTQLEASQQSNSLTSSETLPNPAEPEREADDPSLASLQPVLDDSYPASQRRASSSGGSLSSLCVPPPRMRSIHTSPTSESYSASHVQDNSTPASRILASSQRITSPLATNPAEIAIDPEGWDYAETEWWGWIILIVTWLVFVVGMGSCLGVWSWAWDVGETPYAPPELEDDPTLPIVGYYPALMTLTAVMAWVWVIIAWVGMKYFRHAKISGEDL